MKTEMQIAEKYHAFMLIKDREEAIASKDEIETTIACLLWVLKCDDCKSYPCTCYEPF